MSLSESNITGEEVRKGKDTWDGDRLVEKEEEEERGNVIVPVAKMQVQSNSWCASKSGKGELRIIYKKIKRGS